MVGTGGARSVLRHDLQCHPERKSTPEKHTIGSHAWQHFKRSIDTTRNGNGRGGVGESKSLSNAEHRACTRPLIDKVGEIQNRPGVGEVGRPSAGKRRPWQRQPEQVNKWFVHCCGGGWCGPRARHLPRLFIIPLLTALACRWCRLLRRLWVL
jgi:hypothetical protein